MALPSASLCITMHLASIASLRSTMETRHDRRRRKIMELCLCVVLPCVIMALQYVVQGHRYDIVEDIGCVPNVYYSWPALVVIYVPPLAVAVVSLVYASIALYWFILRRNQFSKHLQSQNRGLMSSRYMRLMAMAVSEIVIETGMGAFLVAETLQDSSLRDWDNWDDVHSNFSRVAQFPRLLIADYLWTRTVLTLYIPPICAIDFFIWFGVGRESLDEYNRAWRWFKTHVLRQASTPLNGSVLPTISAPARPPRMKVHDIEEFSMDDKWDDALDDAHTDVTPTNPSVSLPEQDRDLEPPPRPLSAPPVKRTSQDSNLSSHPKAFSLDLPRLSASASVLQGRRAQQL